MPPSASVEHILSSNANRHISYGLFFDITNDLRNAEQADDVNCGTTKHL